MNSNTKYQVFISSTFVDLKKERQQALKALLDADCIPAGMELFPAADQEQFKFIKEIIDYCDYYLLIIGGRYGSLADDGLSFTEKEYDYAVEKGINIIALLHESPEKLPKSKRDTDPTIIRKLEEFREKVRKDRVVKMWKKDSEILGGVSAAINHAIKKYPATGWVRGDTVATEEILREINELRKEKDTLALELETIKAAITPKVDDLADLEQVVTVNFSYGVPTTDPCSRLTPIAAEMSLIDIFWILSPYFKQEANEETIKNTHFPNGCKSRIELLFLNHSSIIHTNIKSAYLKVDDNDFKTIMIHFEASGLIETFKATMRDGALGTFIKLTPSGEKLMFEMRSIKKGQTSLESQQNADIA